MSMTSDDVDDTPVPTMRSSGPFHRRGGNARQQVDLAHLCKENVRLPCCQFFRAAGVGQPDRENWKADHGKGDGWSFILWSSCCHEEAC